MDRNKAMQARFSVRSYTDAPIEGEALAGLQQAIAAANQDGDLHLQLMLDHPGALKGFPHGDPYIALVGPKGSATKQRLGYYGERVVLTAVNLRLGTCWVGGSHRKNNCRCRVGPEEQLCGVIAVQKPDPARKTKSIAQLSRAVGEMPEWFRCGMQAVQLAPSAINLQPVRFCRDVGQPAYRYSRQQLPRLDPGLP